MAQTEDTVEVVPKIMEGSENPGRIAMSEERLAKVRQSFTVDELKVLSEERRFALICPPALDAVEILELYMHKWLYSLEIIGFARKVVVIAIKEWLRHFVRPGKDGLAEGGTICVGDLAIAGLRVAYVAIGAEDHLVNPKLVDAVGVSRELLAGICSHTAEMVVEVVGSNGMAYISALAMCEWVVVGVMAEYRESIKNWPIVRAQAAHMANQFLRTNMRRVQLPKDAPGHMSTVALGCGVFMLAVKQWERFSMLIDDLVGITGEPKASIRNAERDVLAALDWNIFYSEELLGTLYEFRPTKEVHEFVLFSDYTDGLIAARNV